MRHSALDAALALGAATVLDARRALGAGRKTRGRPVAHWRLADPRGAQHGLRSTEEAGTER